jgi:hypothetical protein
MYEHNVAIAAKLFERPRPKSTESWRVEPPSTIAKPLSRRAMTGLKADWAKNASNSALAPGGHVTTMPEHVSINGSIARSSTVQPSNCSSSFFCPPKRVLEPAAVMRAKTRPSSGSEGAGMGLESEVLIYPDWRG